VNPDGSGLVRVTNDSAADYSPDWSPDRSKIAFVSGRERDNLQQTDIFIMNADGSGIRRLRTAQYLDTFPRWSPDGTKIAFFMGTSDRSSVLAVCNADGTGAKTVMNVGGVASWSPDGKRLVVSANRDGGSKIWLVNADGTGLKLLVDSPKATIGTTNLTGSDSSPAWSPDGTRIVFSRSMGDTLSGLHSVDPNTGVVTRLTEGRDNAPAWAPDVENLVFSSNGGGSSQLYTCKADGTGRTRLLDTAKNQGMADW
jgi:Tol biopolymer transport system component